MKQWLKRFNPLRMRGSVPGAGDVAERRWVMISLVIMRADEVYVTTLPGGAALGRVRLAGADTGVKTRHFRGGVQTKHFLCRSFLFLTWPPLCLHSPV